MAWELVYTSAPRGLTTGSTGFCTVAHSQGLPASLQPRLEALSGYRPPRQKPDDGAMPVRYSHVLLNHAGQTLSVLSRVAAAGVDHTGRSNKLADHRVLMPHERAAAGPAWVARQPNIFREHWQQEPTVLNASASMPAGEQEPGVCSVWADAAGDAGWAGVLADLFLLDPSAPVYVVYDPARHDAARLIDEAVALLPVSRRWDVTFSTYYTDPLGEDGVAWRFVMAGTPAAGAARTANDRGRCIDLTCSLGESPDSAYVCAARTGEPPSVPYELAESEDQPRSDVEAATTATPGTAAGVITNKSTIPTTRLARESTSTHDRDPNGKDRNDIDFNEPARTDTAAWKWVAAAAIPALLVAGGFYAWSGDTADADAGRHSEQDAAEVARLRQQLSESQRRVATLENQVRAPATDNETTAPGDVIDRVIKPEHSPAASTKESLGLAEALSDAEPSTEDDSETVFSEVDVAPRSPVKVAADLPRATTGPAGSASMGTAARLDGAAGWLWQPDDFVARGAALTVTPAWDEADADLRWRTGADAAELVCRSVDALGTPRDVVLGRVSLSDEGVRWSWTDATLPRSWAGRREALWWHAAATTFVVHDAQQQTLAEIQGIVPVEASANINARPTAIPWASTAVPAALRIDAPPTGWSAELRPDGRRLDLRGPAGSTLHLRLTDADSQVKVETSWARDADELRTSAAELERRAQTLAGWLERHAALKEQHEIAGRSLPRNDDREVLHTFRSDPKFYAVFERYDRAQDELAAHADEQPGFDAADAATELDQLRQRVAAMTGQALEMQGFPGARVEVIASRSGAVAAHIAISQEEPS